MKKENEENPISLEEAIETLSCFTEPHKSEMTPSLDSFELKAGEFKVRTLTSFEKTLSPLIAALSRNKREKEESRNIQIKKRLLHSVDIIKIAILKLEGGGAIEKGLEEKLQKVATQYNHLLKTSQKLPRSFFQRIKYFILKITGKLLDEEVQRSEIPLSDRKISYSKSKKEKNDDSSHALVAPKHQEVDLFFAKAYTLLRSETPEAECLDDMLKSLRDNPIKATLKAESIISLDCALTPLPGETIQLSGGFSRTPAMSIPIRESFRICTSAEQSGYPHPLQHIGFALSKEVIGFRLLRPYLAPRVDALLKKKEEIAKELLPGRDLNKVAKQLLLVRKKVFYDNREEITARLETFLEAFLKAAGKKWSPSYFNLFRNEKNYFEQVSFFHHDVVLTHMSKPLRRLEEAWLTDRLKHYEEFPAIVKNTIHEETSLGHALAAALQDAVLPLGSFLFFERLQKEPPSLDLFSKKILAASFSELKDFHFELEYLKPSEKGFLDWIIASIEKKIGLFCSSAVVDPLVKELEDYAMVRRLGSQESAEPTSSAV
jgi:hypothetical protein